jgi:hypothetical protein
LTFNTDPRGRLACKGDAETVGGEVEEGLFAKQSTTGFADGLGVGLGGVRMVSGGVSSVPARTGVDKAAREAVAIITMSMNTIPRDKVNFCSLAIHSNVYFRQNG